jgi:2-polyprenyl-3-methyl-5-hydroxy-6-metoxy-1,4-benzoquinol methylase
METASPPRKIEYLSTPAEVSMADRWFEIASGDHFWVRRRFEVLQGLAAGIISDAQEMAEVGCGHGLLQRQVEDAYAREVTGFDLNEYALKQNVSRRSRVCCYDIFQRDPALHWNFDVLFLFDVLEHIADEDRFLDALLFHLKPKGKLVINVPAGQWAFSSYDSAAGHVRRYSIRTLRERARRNGLEMREWSYWGLPLVPTLVLRKLWLMGQHDQSRIIASGFDSRSTAINSALGALSRCEWIPQKLFGTSLMAILQREKEAGASGSR